MMNATQKDAARRFQGERYGASIRGAKRAAAHLGVSRQAIDQRVAGKTLAISYAELAKLAEDPRMNRKSVLDANQIVPSLRRGER